MTMDLKEILKINPTVQFTLLGDYPSAPARFSSRGLKAKTTRNKHNTSYRTGKAKYKTHKTCCRTDQTGYKMDQSAYIMHKTCCTAGETASGEDKTCCTTHQTVSGEDKTCCRTDETTYSTDRATGGTLKNGIIIAAS